MTIKRMYIYNFNFDLQRLYNYAIDLNILTALPILSMESNYIYSPLEGFRFLKNLSFKIIRHNLPLSIMIK